MTEPYQIQVAMPDETCGSGELQIAISDAGGGLVFAGPLSALVEAVLMRVQPVRRWPVSSGDPGGDCVGPAGPG